VSLYLLHCAFLNHQTIKYKIFVDLLIFFVEFEKFTFLRNIFQFRPSMNFPWGQVSYVPHKCGPYRFRCSDVYWIRTYKQAFWAFCAHLLSQLLIVALFVSIFSWYLNKSNKNKISQI